MNTYDLCFAWNWDFDADFAKLLDGVCRAYGLSLLHLTPQNLADGLQALNNRKISFRSFWDRASDSDATFMPLVHWARRRAVYHINPYEQAVHTWDKATMHLRFINAGLQTPYTIILPSYQEYPVLPSIDLSPLGKSFIIKPAHGGGGDGVFTEVTLLSQVLAARQHYPHDKYLLQFHIVPIQLGSRPAWFRVIYCAGKTYPCWWNTDTHIYIPVTPTEERYYRLEPLHEIGLAIARICKLDLFSTEIALNAEGVFVVVDYVNDPIDLRLQSHTPDGVPNEIVHNIAERLSRLVAVYRVPFLSQTRFRPI